MSETVISVEGLGKRYRIGQKETYGTLRDSLMRAANPGRWLRRHTAPAAPDEREFWALRDVSFEVQRGEVLGIIGRNGAGKSTLLKILSRITRPTKGRAEVRGRVASLLEVGTGFHAELTGRENVFLNGAILGMPKAEITKKFDEIVAFAEVERFIDTPVKRYSSGMYLRLAFSVAAHLEPDILIVDEVLAVGDMAFQKRCMGKMKDVSRGGRTVLFVSHNLQAVRALCDEAMVIDAGRIRFRGSPEQAVREYLSATASPDESRDQEPTTEKAKAKKAHIEGVACLEAQSERPCWAVNRGEKIMVRISVTISSRLWNADVSFAVLSASSAPVFSETFADQEGFGPLDPGRYHFDVLIDSAFLKLEPYSLEAFITEDGSAVDRYGGVPLPEVEDPNANPHQEARRWGVVRLPVSWKKTPRNRTERSEAEFRPKPMPVA
jgi:lipopolysaccharide transport system ATP-binding protein